MLQFGSKHVCIEDVHIFKHCREMTLFLLWIGTYCISCVVQQTSGVKDLSSLVRYDDSCLAAIRHVQSIILVVRPRPNIRSHSVLFILCSPCLSTKFNLELIYLNESSFHTSFKLAQRGNPNIPTHYGLKEFQKISLPPL